MGIPPPSNMWYGEEGAGLGENGEKGTVEKVFRKWEARIVVDRANPKLLRPFRKFESRNEPTQKKLRIMPNMSKPGGRIFWREGVHKDIVVDVEEGFIAAGRGDWGWRDHEHRFQRRWMRRRSWRGC